MSLLMWGVVYQGYNAVFPSFCPEMFPARTRVSGMAISQNLGTLVTAMLPALFVAVAPPGVANILLMIGSITLGVTIIAAIAAWTSRETFRVQMNDLGDRHATPVPEAEYNRLRAGLHRCKRECTGQAFLVHLSVWAWIQAVDHCTNAEARLGLTLVAFDHRSSLCDQSEKLAHFTLGSGF